MRELEYRVDSEEEYDDFPTPVRQIFHDNDETTPMPVRLIAGKEILVDDSPETWAPLVEYEYDWDDGVSDEWKYGINRPSKITRYVNADDPPDTITIDITYEDEAFPDAYPEGNPTSLTFPSSVTIQPEGRRVTFEYNAAGQITEQKAWQYDLGDEEWDELSTTTWTYNTSGENIGLVSSVTTDPAAGPTRSIGFVYSTASGEGRAGMIKQIITDQGGTDPQTTSFVWGDWGNPLSVSNPDGSMVHWQYSDNVYELYDEEFYPPRVIEIDYPTNDRPTNEEVHFYYDEAGRVSEVHSGHYEGEYFAAVKTEYEYDLLGNVSRIVGPSQEESLSAPVIEFKHTIYGHLRQMTEFADGTTVSSVTEYTHDAFGRLVSEVLHDGDDPPNEVRTLTYDYTSGDCGCSAGGSGGAFQVARRDIINSDHTVTDSLFFKYDFLGRVTGQGTTSDADDIIYAFDGLRLASVTHEPGSLWGTGTYSFEYDDHLRLARETGPGGRSISYAYDAANRLTSLTDPFGFATGFQYDDSTSGGVNNRGRGFLETVGHDVLGATDFLFDAKDRLSRVNRANGADTLLTYKEDSPYGITGRLISIDHRNDSDATMIKHAWVHDKIGRKDDLDSTGDITVTGLADAITIDIEYDLFGNLASETLTGGMSADPWDVQYTYDDNNNRTGLDDGTVDVTLEYGPGNREVTVDQSGTLALEYDFRGNVTTRPLLDGSKTYTYGWDEYDQLTSVTASGQDPVEFFYDAAGRLVRAESVGTSESTVSLFHWVGLNLIARETVVTDGPASAITSGPVMPIPVPGADPVLDGWMTTVPEEVANSEYVTDGTYGKVFHAWSDGSYGSAVWGLGDDPDNLMNPNGGPLDSAYTLARVRVKNDHPTGGSYGLYFLGRDTAGGRVELIFLTEAGTDYKAGYHYIVYLGTSYNDGSWHEHEIDVAAEMDMLRGGSDPPLARIDAVAVIQPEADIYVDDFILTDPAITGYSWTTYQVVPGAAVGGTIAALTDATADPDRWWYHTNDTGTVIATSDAEGEEIGVYAPDFFGRYRHVEGDRPDEFVDELGLTGKMFQSQAGAYYFGARWLDPERGRWLSEEPLGWGGPNLYHFNWNDPVNYYDPDGRHPILVVLGGMAAFAFWLFMPDPSDPLIYSAVKMTEGVACAVNGAVGDINGHNAQLQAAMDGTSGSGSGNPVPTPRGSSGRGRGNGGNGPDSGPDNRSPQEHHYATNKNKTYKPDMEALASRYGLDLDGDWNKDILPQNGRHPNDYHDWVRDGMKEADRLANGDVSKFLSEYDRLVKAPVRADPSMLYKAHWVLRKIK